MNMGYGEAIRNSKVVGLRVGKPGKFRSEENPDHPRSVMQDIEITGQEWNFLFLHYIKGVDIMKAYGKAFPHARKMQFQNRAIEVKQLLSQKRITKAIGDMRAEAMLGAKMTLDQHLHQLCNLRDKAAKKGDITSAIRAQQLIGQACGHHDQKVTHEHFHVSDENAVKAEIAKLLKENPELAPPPKLIDVQVVAESPLPIPQSSDPVPILEQEHRDPISKSHP